MKLIVLEHYVPYEGCEFFGVFSTAENAKAHAEVVAGHYDPFRGGDWATLADGTFEHRAEQGLYQVTAYNLDEGATL